jgi:hypothetical protein
MMSLASAKTHKKVPTCSCQANESNPPLSQLRITLSKPSKT